MSNPTTPFSWQMPTATDLVTDLPADFEVFGQAVATSMADLLGGTTGQILSKASNTDMDFTWIANDQGDITAVNVTSPITGGGSAGAVTVGIQDASTSQKGSVQLSDSTSTTSSILAATPTAVKASYDLAAAAIPKSTVTTNGDLIYGTGSATVSRIGVGSSGQVLTVSGGVPAWATPAATASNLNTATFTSSTTWTVPTGVTRVRYFLCAGGGAGGGSTGITGVGTGGGGGGQVKEGILSVTAGASLTVTIGAGGSGSTGAGAQGGNSVFSSVTSYGGGGGGSNSQGTSSSGTVGNAGGRGITIGGAGKAGGGGGGGAGSTGGHAVGLSTPIGGDIGGLSSGNGNAGGGGMYSNGGVMAGNGGGGIFGYGSGGGGGLGDTKVGLGGQNAGNGSDSAAGGSATANFGGGGGGLGGNNPSFNGGNGGSGFLRLDWVS